MTTDEKARLVAWLRATEGQFRELRKSLASDLCPYCRGAGKVPKMCRRCGGTGAK